MSYGRILKTGEFVRSVIENFDDYNNLLKEKKVYDVSDIIDIGKLRLDTNHFYNRFNELVGDSENIEFKIREISSRASPARTYELTSDLFHDTFVVISICLILPIYVCYSVNMTNNNQLDLGQIIVDQKTVCLIVKDNIQKSFGKAYEQWSLKDINQKVLFRNSLIMIKDSSINDICFDTNFIKYAVSDL